MPAAPVIGAIAAAVGAGYSVYSGQRAASEQRKVRRKGEVQAKRAEQDANRNNRNPANADALLAQQDSGVTGGSSTMLTGPQGVNLDDSSLGRNTLLGG